ncbi:trypsin-like peptidase domain-containing protein [Halopseudomonas sabulinigri]|uniref:DUF4124 domain-containing protein n=1 Tax=Halopseudomonas sabulinigri TaxID=472181 RepID=A0ABP9ZNX1_9GAMM
MEQTLFRITKNTAAVVVACTLLAGAATAQKLYRWVDEKGVSHFSQTPPPATSEIEFESQQLEKRREVDLECCQEARLVAQDMAGYLTRGLPLIEIHSLVNVEGVGQAELTELANFASDRVRLDMSPVRVGSEAYKACSNGVFLACRTGATSSAGTQGSSGSGFWVNSSVVITNSHVVEKCSRISVADDLQADLLFKDATNDLAALRVSGVSGNRALIRGDVGIQHGESVVAAGFPLSGIVADDLNITTGIVSAVAGMGGDKRFVQITAPVQLGNSGGPLIDQKGLVIGVVTSKLNAMGMAQRTGDIAQNVNFALSLDTLTNFMAQNGIAFNVAPLDGEDMTVTEISQSARGWTVPVSCEP